MPWSAGPSGLGTALLTESPPASVKARPLGRPTGSRSARPSAGRPSSSRTGPPTPTQRTSRPSSQRLPGRERRQGRGTGRGAWQGLPRVCRSAGGGPGHDGAYGVRSACRLAVGGWTVAWSEQAPPSRWSRRPLSDTTPSRDRRISVASWPRPLEGTAHLRPGGAPGPAATKIAAQDSVTPSAQGRWPVNDERGRHGDSCPERHPMRHSTHGVVTPELHRRVDLGRSARILPGCSGRNGRQILAEELHGPVPRRSWWSDVRKLKNRLLRSPLDLRRSTRSDSAGYAGPKLEPTSPATSTQARLIDLSSPSKATSARAIPASRCGKPISPTRYVAMTINFA